MPVTPRDIMAMGVGGLLKEIEVRPLPRADARMITAAINAVQPIGKAA